MTREDCPEPAFQVPELSGVLHRSVEYPEGSGVFEAAGHYEWWLFATTQSTKIGRETCFLQNDPRGRKTELLCALSSFSVAERWPFVDLEQRPADESIRERQHYDWGEHRLMMADVGCLYFLIDRKGRVSTAFDSY